MRAGVGGEHREQGAGQGHDGVQVHRQHRVELRGADLREQPPEGDARIVDQQRGVGVRPGQCRPGAFGGGVVGEVDDVGGDPDGAGRPDVLRDAGQAPGVAVEQHEVAAAFGEPRGQRGPDAARGAGDDGRPAGEAVAPHHTASASRRAAPSSVTSTPRADEKRR